MSARIKKIHHPKNSRELIDLLKKGRGRVAPVGGGVSFAFSVPPKVSELASLRSLGLERIFLDKKGLHIGAMATVARLAESEAARRFLNGLFADVASRVAATPNRNLITVGGNAVRLFIWSDLPLAYCAAGALFVVRGGGGTKTVKSEKFYARQPLVALKRSEYLEEIIIPRPRGRSGAAHEKFSETSNNFALLSAAACVSLDRAGSCEEARLAIGGLQLLPGVSGRAEKILKGRIPTPERIKEAAAASISDYRVVPDMRVSLDYKKKMAVTIARRVLTEAFARAGSPD